MNEKYRHSRVSFAQKLLQFLLRSFIGDPVLNGFCREKIKCWIPDEAPLPKTEGVFGRHYLGNDELVGVART